MPRTIVIAQARMGSSRLPGKVLAEVAGRPVLEHVVRRAERISGIDGVCLATTTNAEDDAVARLAADLGVPAFRGHPTDVLDRYARAAEAMQADVVMRITCDCPLIDPLVCSAVLALRAAGGVDYAANVERREWPHGLDCEAFTRALLETAAATATAPYDREHVTPWMRRHAPARAHLPGPGGDAAAARWTLDYPEDLAFLRALFGRLPDAATAGWQEILAVVRGDPDLAAINAGRRVAAEAGE